MSKKLYILSLFSLLFITFSCSSPQPKEIVGQLNGYWKIAEVKQPDGQVRIYKMNPAVDYIEIDSTLNGIRVKVQPQFDGSFKTTKNAEHFSLARKNDSLRFHYTTDLAEWTETLVDLKKDQFIVKDTAGTVYTYKRFTSLKDALHAYEQAKK